MYFYFTKSVSKKSTYTHQNRRLYLIENLGKNLASTWTIIPGTKGEPPLNTHHSQELWQWESKHLPMTLIPLLSAHLGRWRTQHRNFSKTNKIYKIIRWIWIVKVVKQLDVYEGIASCFTVRSTCITQQLMPNMSKMFSMLYSERLGEVTYTYCIIIV